MQVRIRPCSVLRDNYQVEVKRWWWPFWWNTHMNTFSDLAAARKYAEHLKFNLEVT